MVYIPTETGHWVDEKFERLARVVNEYNPQLELRWIPPDRRTIDDKQPYAVFDTRFNHVVFYASGLDTPQEILARLFRGDLTKGNPLERIEAAEAADRILKMKEKMDMYDEAADEAKFLMQSPLNTLRFKGKKFDHNRRVVD